jgi:hypothetical protein
MHFPARCRLCRATPGQAAEPGRSPGNTVDKDFTSYVPPVFGTVVTPDQGRAYSADLRISAKYRARRRAAIRVALSFHRPGPGAVPLSLSGREVPRRAVSAGPVKPRILPCQEPGSGSLRVVITPMAGFLAHDNDRHPAYARFARFYPGRDSRRGLGLALTPAAGPLAKQHWWRQHTEKNQYVAATMECCRAPRAGRGVTASPRVPCRPR